MILRYLDPCWINGFRGLGGFVASGPLGCRGLGFLSFIMFRV